MTKRKSWFDDCRQAYTFDDVSLSPDYSTLYSRSEIDISSEIVDGIKCKIPIIPANMNTITEARMVNAMVDLGATGALHRFTSPIRIVEQWDQLKSPLTCGITVGVKNPEIIIDTFSKINNFRIGYVIVDIAHGDHIMVKETIDLIRETQKSKPTRWGNVKIIAGNICTAKAAERYVEWGVDGIKGGTGPGGSCSTREEAGAGVPQLDAIRDISMVVRQGDYSVPSKIKIIADGGIRKKGDAIKAFAAGADFVMVGTIIAGTTETPGDVLTTGHGENRKKLKVFSGSSSIDVRANFHDKEAEDISPEGVSIHVPYQGSVSKIIKEWAIGIRDGISYYGCKNIAELQEWGSSKDVWNRITLAGSIEGKPHAMYSQG